MDGRPNADSSCNYFLKKSFGLISSLEVIHVLYSPSIEWKHIFSLRCQACKTNVYYIHCYLWNNPSPFEAGLESFLVIKSVVFSLIALSLNPIEDFGCWTALLHVSNLYHTWNVLQQPRKSWGWGGVQRERGGDNLYKRCFHFVFPIICTTVGFFHSQLSIRARKRIYPMLICSSYPFCVSALN